MTFAQPSPPTALVTTPRSASGSVSSSVPLTHGRRRPAIQNESAAYHTSKIGEIAGGTAAVCCFPCGIVGLAVFAVVKLPAGLCKKAYVKKRRQRLRATKTAMWGPQAGFSFDDADLQCVRMREDWGIPTAELSPEEAAMDGEMWASFYETGFWRSPSQREDH